MVHRMGAVGMRKACGNMINLHHSTWLLTDDLGMLWAAIGHNVTCICMSKRWKLVSTGVLNTVIVPGIGDVMRVGKQDRVGTALQLPNSQFQQHVCHIQ